MANDKPRNRSVKLLIYLAVQAIFLVHDSRHHPPAALVAQLQAADLDLRNMDLNGLLVIRDRACAVRDAAQDLDGRFIRADDIIETPQQRCMGDLGVGFQRSPPATRAPARLRP